MNTMVSGLQNVSKLARLPPVSQVMTGWNKVTNSRVRRDSGKRKGLATEERKKRTIITVELGVVEIQRNAVLFPVTNLR